MIQESWERAHYCDYVSLGHGKLNVGQQAVPIGFLLDCPEVYEWVSQKANLHRFHICWLEFGVPKIDQQFGKIRIGGAKLIA